MVSTRSLLGARIGALQSQIKDAEHLLEQAERVDPELERVDPRLHARLTGRFEDILNARRRELGTLAEDSRRGEPLPDCWTRLEAIRDACVSFFGECLAFLQGALARQEGLDGGICQVADHLLDRIAEDTRVTWSGLTMMAKSDFYGDTAEIIGLRFPHSSLWHLPVAVHEFAHFAGPRLGLDPYTRLRTREALAADGLPDTDDTAPEQTYPIQQILTREWARGNRIRWSYVYELFADVFATYAVGPSYAHACVYLRFDPSSAQHRTLSHPSAAERVHVVLKTLRTMDEEAGMATSFDPELGRLEATWRASVASAGAVPELADEDVARLDGIWAEFYARLRDRPSGLPYATFLRARGVSSALQQQPLGADRVDPHRDALPDLLNGAWLAAAAHWDNPARVKQIGSRALDLLHDLVRLQRERPMVRPA